MRKNYCKPELNVVQVNTEGMLALSIIQGGTADQGKDVLVKGNDWDIFGDAPAGDSATDSDVLFE